MLKHLRVDLLIDLSIILYIISGEVTEALKKIKFWVKVYIWIIILLKVSSD